MRTVDPIPVPWGNQEKLDMRYVRKAPSMRAKGERPLAAKHMSYEKLAVGLAFEMAACVRSRDASEFCAPFELVIVDPQGAVVFSCEVGEDGQVWHDGPARAVRRNHFPATALLTDRSLVTRTFQIDRASC
jgi:hypothetical protein